MIAKNDLVLKALVLGGHGMALLPAEEVNNVLATGQLIQLLPKKSKPVTVTIDVGYKRHRTQSYLHSEFLTFVASQGV